MRNILCVGASTDQRRRARPSRTSAPSPSTSSPRASASPRRLPARGPHVRVQRRHVDGDAARGGRCGARAAAEPTLSAGDLKDILLASADAGKLLRTVASGGRLDVRAAAGLAQVGTSLPDGDGDGFPDAADACATSAASTRPTAAQTRTTTASPTRDNCPSTFDPGQQNSDGRADGGDACDRDYDSDGRPNAADACPTVYGTSANGCPPPPPPPPPSNVDGDDRIDSLDACPTEYAISNDGCPIAQIATVSPRVESGEPLPTATTVPTAHDGADQARQLDTRSSRILIR